MIRNPREWTSSGVIDNINMRARIIKTSSIDIDSVIIAPVIVWAPYVRPGPVDVAFQLDPTRGFCPPRECDINIDSISRWIAYGTILDFY